MNQILHTIYIKHDTSFKSLTKRALAQILIKIIFLNRNKGIPRNKLKTQLNQFTGVQFHQNDIDSALNRLEVHEKRIYQKSGNFRIKPKYLKEIESAVNESNELHKNVINHWFSESSTFKTQEFGSKIIDDWFKKMLIEFFKEYSYDWINDLRIKKTNGKKKKPNVQKLLRVSFDQTQIQTEDHQWLQDQFMGFLQSERKQDDDLLWIYGSSMFSSALLTARNYADEISMDIFRDSNFILDTNVLMILGLEGYEKSEAFKTLEEAFNSLDIQPGYFHSSKLEYQRAIGPKHDATISALRKFDFNVISDTDCPFIKTALKRMCRTEEDFNRFFRAINQPPEEFYQSMELKHFDHSDLLVAIEEGENDNEVTSAINKVYNSRTNRNKRDKPLRHDAGLIAGAQYLKKERNTWVVTRDFALREYAFETSVRDENPIAIGLDSLIQMLAIENGGSTVSSTDFAPLFGKLVSHSIMPNKDLFTMEDLYFIEKSHIEIDKLPNRKAIEIAKYVNKLRLRGMPDEDIVLEIQRSFQSGVTELSTIVDTLKSDKSRLEKSGRQVDSELKNIKQGLIASEIENREYKLKAEIRSNWYKLIAIPIILSVLIYFVLKLNPEISKHISLLVSVATEIISTLCIAIFSKWKLKVSEIDREKISKEINQKYK